MTSSLGHGKLYALKLCVWASIHSQNPLYKGKFTFVVSLRHIWVSSETHRDQSVAKILSGLFMHRLEDSLIVKIMLRSRTGSCPAADDVKLIRSVGFLFTPRPQLLLCNPSSPSARPAARGKHAAVLKLWESFDCCSIFELIHHRNMPLLPSEEVHAVCSMGMWWKTYIQKYLFNCIV